LVFAAITHGCWERLIRNDSRPTSGVTRVHGSRSSTGLNSPSPNRFGVTSTRITGMDDCSCGPPRGYRVPRQARACDSSENACRPRSSFISIAIPATSHIRCIEKDGSHRSTKESMCGADTSRRSKGFSESLSRIPTIPSGMPIYARIPCGSPTKSPASWASATPRKYWTS
jgi:hypothetical protein